MKIRYGTWVLEFKEDDMMEITNKYSSVKYHLWKHSNGWIRQFNIHGTMRTLYSTGEISDEQTSTG